MFPENNRMTSTSEFNFTRKVGKKFSTNFFDLFYVAQRNPVSPTRIGIVATLRFSPISPIRNKVKRIFRELVRPNLAKIKPGYLLVIHPKRASLDTKYEELSLEFNKVLSQLPLS